MDKGWFNTPSFKGRYSSPLLLSMFAFSRAPNFFILKVIYISCIKSNELLIIFYDLMEIFLPIDDLKLISFSFPFFAII